MALTRDEIVAAYLLDRADQYVTESPCWIALADAANNVLHGEHAKSYQEGEFDETLIARIRKLKALGREAVPVDPRAGVEEGG